MFHKRCVCGEIFPQTLPLSTKWDVENRPSVAVPFDFEFSVFCYKKYLEITKILSENLRLLREYFSKIIKFMTKYSIINSNLIVTFYKLSLKQEQYG